MKRVLLPFLVGGLVSASFAVSGISVVMAEGTGYTQYYGRTDGKLWRCEVNDDQVENCEEIFAGPVTRPCLSPDGKHIGFLKGSKVCVMPTEGGDVKELATAHNHSYMDFPDNEWIYYTTGGGFHEENSQIVDRANIETGATENAFSLASNNRISQFGVSNDLSRAVIRPGDDDSQFHGGVAGLEIGGSDYHQISPLWSCAVGISSDGKYALDGWGDHDGFDVRNWGDGGDVTSFRNSEAVGWPPLSDGSMPSKHAIFHSAGATNDPDWICIVVGNSPGSASARDDVNQYQLLINWQDHNTICPNKAFEKVMVDHGDFWVGDPNSVLHPDEVRMRREIQRHGFAFSSVGERFFLPDTHAEAIQILDVSGRVVRSLPANARTLVWDGRDQGGRAVATGAYVARLISAGSIVGTCALMHSR